jgi:hypothetical protein
MHAIALRLNGSAAGVVLPALVAGVIYVIIAVSTGAGSGASMVGGLVVAALAVTVGSVIRAVFKHRSTGPHS